MDPIKASSSSFFDPAKANRDSINKYRSDKPEHSDSVHDDAHVDETKSSTDEVGEKKPAPEPFDKVLAKLIDQQIEEFHEKEILLDPGEKARRQGILPVDNSASAASSDNARRGIHIANDWGLGV